MGQVLRQDSIGEISKTSTTAISVAASFVTIGGRQYNTSSISISTAVSGAGGIDTGSIAASQFYYIYLVKTSSGVYGTLSLSSTAPTGFSAYKLVGQCTTDASSLLVSADKSKVDDSPIGHIISAMLTESQFRAIHGSGWVLADGRSAVGSKYASVTAASTIPDLRGMTLRGLNNGGSALGARADGKQDPDSRTLGSDQGHATAKNSLDLSGTTTFASSSHEHRTPIGKGGSGASHLYFKDGAYTGVADSTDGGTSSGTSTRVLDIGLWTASTGGPVTLQRTDGPSGTGTVSLGAGDTETRMRNVAVNHFIKIN